ncbi:unnamed protein product [Rotaria sordida]|uniref:Uncharacterized protein n=1 Tax=Rotaria sordida TaxID=392033 RepID=A0A815KIV1_9BILA|nr:unnamed protein product [Rotaria sordida]CAF4163186.1 unnamed protein product [Rotaria sordida]
MATIFDKQLYQCDSTDVCYVQIPTSDEIMNALNNVNYNQTHISPKCDCWEQIQTCSIGAGVVHHQVLI